MKRLSDQRGWWWRDWAGERGGETASRCKNMAYHSLVCVVRCRGSSLIAIVPAPLGLPPAHRLRATERNKESECNRKTSRLFIPLSLLSRISHPTYSTESLNTMTTFRVEKKRAGDMSFSHTCCQVNWCFSSFCFSHSPFTTSVLKWLIMNSFLTVTITNVDCMQIFLFKRSLDYSSVWKIIKQMIHYVINFIWIAINQAACKK